MFSSTNDLLLEFLPELGKILSGFLIAGMLFFSPFVSRLKQKTDTASLLTFSALVVFNLAIALLVSAAIQSQSLFFITVSVFLPFLGMLWAFFALTYLQREALPPTLRVFLRMSLGIKLMAMLIAFSALSFLETNQQTFMTLLTIGFLAFEIGGIVSVAVLITSKLNYLASMELHMQESDHALQRKAVYDDLTGLRNRQAFLIQLAQYAHEVTISKSSVAVLYLDIDRFHQINDGLGLLTGDLLLKAIADNLRSLRGDSSQVFRTGEDEFAVFLECAAEHVDAAVMAEEILASFSRPILVRNSEIYLTVSIGITFLDPEIADATQAVDTVMQQIDHSLELAKLDRNTYRFFTGNLVERGLSKMHYINYLRQAIDREELSLHFQPQIQKDGSTVGAEALLRWNNAVLGSVPPQQFIPIAEEAGLIIPLGDWVIEHACAELAHWKSLGIDIPLAINLSTRQLKDPRLERSLLLRLKKYGLHPESLHLEITESSVFEENQMTMETLKSLSDLGFKLSIDDFGTGYANLSYLKRLPVSAVKIDRSFVVDLPDNQQDQAMIQAICSMAEKMGLSIIAEGVDNERQLRCLHDADCNVVQGFYYSRPLPRLEFVEFLRTRIA